MFREPEGLSAGDPTFLPGVGWGCEEKARSRFLPAGHCRTTLLGALVSGVVRV